MTGGRSFGREFVCLDAMRTARAMFFDSIVSHARHHRENRRTDKEQALAAQLRGDNAYQIAEFYYMAEEVRLGDPDRIAAFIDRHNTDMAALLDDPDQLTRMGLSKARVREAIFSPEQKAKVHELAAVGRLRLDQSDVGRLLATLISPETCRKTLVAMAEAGLLERRNIGQIMVISNGVIEGYFREHLRYITDAVISAQE